MAFFSVKSDRFLDAQNLSLVLQQVMVVGVLAIGQTLVILTAGIDLSVGTVMALGQVVMTKLAIDNGMSPLLAIAVGILTCVAFGVLNGGLVTLVRVTGVHRHARDAEHRVRADPHRLERPDVLGAPEPAALLREDVHGRRRELHLRRRLHARAVRDRLVRAHADRLGATRLRRRRQPRGRAADRHQHESRAAERLHARRADVGDRGAAPRRAHRARRSERGPDDREPRQHHRGRHRRHEPVRRAGKHHRDAHRRRDRRASSATG